MRPLSAIAAAITSKPGYMVFGRVLIADADDVLRDYGNLAGLNWLDLIEIDESNDNPTAVAKVTLFRAHSYVSLAPLQDSRLNRDSAGAYARILDLGRRIEIWAAFGGSDSGPANWESVFEGHVFDIDWGRADENRVIVNARDLGGKLIDRFIEDDKVVYSVAAGSAVEGVMQDVLDANMTAPDVSPTLVTIGTPAWNIRAYQQDRMGTGEAVRRLAMQIGWDVRYLWNVAASAWRYTFYEPPRVAAVTPDRVWTRDNYSTVSQQSYSLEAVRNRVRVTFVEKTAPYATVSVQWEDAASIAKYGVRFCEVSNGATSGIDTTAEADRMAEALLADLSEPRSYITLSTPGFYLGQLGDTLEIEKDGVTFDQAIKIIVYKHSLRIGRGAHSSTWVGRQAGGGYKDRWLEAEVRPGIAPRQDLALDSNVLRAYLDAGTSQSIPTGVATTVVFDVEGYDYGSNYDATTGEFTAPATGQYEIKAGVQMAPSGAGITASLDVFRNGTKLASGDTLVTAVSPEYLRAGASFQLETGDVVTIRFLHNGAGSEDVDGGRDTYFLVRRLRGG